MKTIIVTGGIGSGKSVVCAEFEKKGAAIISGDKIGHKCLMPNGAAYDSVVAEFGKIILNTDGTINREMLGKIAFASRESLDRLNAVTHKYILKEIVELVDKIVGYDMIVLEIPLFRAVDIPHDVVISVIADKELRIERVMKRGNMSREVVSRIMEMQPSDDEYRKYADFCIENNGEIDQLRVFVGEILEKISGDRVEEV